MVISIFQLLPACSHLGCLCIYKIQISSTITFISDSPRQFVGVGRYDAVSDRKTKREELNFHQWLWYSITITSSGMQSKTRQNSSYKISLGHCLFIIPNDVQYMVNGRAERALYYYFNLHSCSKALYENLMSSGYHSSPYRIITWDQHYLIKVKEKALILFISHLPQTIIIY